MDNSTVTTKFATWGVEENRNQEKSALIIPPEGANTMDAPAVNEGAFEIKVENYQVKMDKEEIARLKGRKTALADKTLEELGRDAGRE